MRSEDALEKRKTAPWQTGQPTRVPYPRGSDKRLPRAVSPGRYRRGIVCRPEEVCGRRAKGDTCLAGRLANKRFEGESRNPLSPPNPDQRGFDIFARHGRTPERVLRYVLFRPRR